MQHLSDIEKSYMSELKQIVPIQMFYKITPMLVCISTSIT